MSILRKKIKQLIGVSFIDTIYKSILFRDFFIALSPKLLRCKVGNVRSAQARKIEQLHKQDKCRVVFFLQTPSIWKYDALYRKLEKSECFEPLVVISPYNVHLIYDKQECFKVMRETEK